MKQSNEAELIRSIEERGAARERERYFATIGAITGELKKLTDRMTALMLKLEAKNEAAGPRPQPKKRKAVEASGECLKAVMDVFETAPAGMTFLPKNIQVGFGLKTVAASCRMLVESDDLEKVGAKGYRLAQRKENGLDETTLPSE